MIRPELVYKRIREQALKEAMLYEAFIILAEVEWLQQCIEQKLLELDTTFDDNRIEAIGQEVRSLLAGLHREEDNMDAFMVKYRGLINETQEVLPNSLKKRPAYLRGVSSHVIRQNAGKSVQRKVGASVR